MKKAIRSLKAPAAVSGLTMTAILGFSGVASADTQITDNAAFVSVPGTNFSASYGMTSDGTRIWIASSTGGTNSHGYVSYCKAIGTVTCTNLQDPSFHTPWGIASSGKYVFVANSGSNTLTKIDAATQSVVGTISGSALTAPFDLTFGGHYLWADNAEGNVVKLSADGTILATSSDPRIKGYDEGFSENSAMSFDGTYLWMISDSTDSRCNGMCVVGLNPATLAVDKIYPYAASSNMDFADAQDVYSDGTSLWVTSDSNDYYAYQINLATGTAVKHDITNTLGPEDCYGFTDNGSQIIFNAAFQTCNTTGSPECLAVYNKTTQSLQAITNASLEAAGTTLQAGTQMTLWANGCLWLAPSYAGTGLFRFCNSPSVTPFVDSASPTTGPTSGGTKITITGSDFVSGAAVTVGGKSCTNVVIVTSSEITCTAPKGTKGNTQISVTDPGSDAAIFSYEYTAATKTSHATTTTVTSTTTPSATLAKTGSNFESLWTSAAFASVLGAGLLLMRRKRTLSRQQVGVTSSPLRAPSSALRGLD